MPGTDNAPKSTADQQTTPKNTQPTQNYAENFAPYKQIMNIGQAASLPETDRRLMKYDDSTLIVYPTIAGSLCKRICVVCAVENQDPPDGVPPLTHEKFLTTDKTHEQELKNLLPTYIQYKNTIKPFSNFSSISADTADGHLNVIKNKEIITLTPKQILSTKNWSQIKLIDIVTGKLIEEATKTLTTLKTPNYNKETFNTEFKKQQISYIDPAGTIRNVQKNDVQKLLETAWVKKENLTKEQLTDILMFVIQNKTNYDYMYEPEQLNDDDLKQKFYEFITACFGEDFIEQSANLSMINKLKSKDIKNIIFVDEQSCSNKDALIWTFKVNENLIISNLNATNDVFTLINGSRGVASAAKRLKTEPYTLTTEKINHEKTLSVKSYQIERLTQEQKTILQKSNTLADRTYDDDCKTPICTNVVIQTGSNTTFIPQYTLHFCETHEWTQDYNYKKNEITDQMINDACNALTNLYNELNSEHTEEEIKNKLKETFTHDQIPCYLDYGDGQLHPWTYAQQPHIETISHQWHGNRNPLNNQFTIGVDAILSSFIYVVLSCNNEPDKIYTVPFTRSNPIYQTLLKKTYQTIGQDTSLLDTAKADNQINELLKSNAISSLRVIDKALELQTNQIRGLTSGNANDKTLFLFKSGQFQKPGERINTLRALASEPTTLGLPLVGDNKYKLSDDGTTLTKDTAPTVEKVSKTDKLQSKKLLTTLTTCIDRAEPWEKFSQETSKDNDIILPNKKQIKIAGLTNETLAKTDWKKVLETNTNTTNTQIKTDQIEKTKTTLQNLKQNRNFKEIETTSKYYYSVKGDTLKDRQINFQQTKKTFTDVWDGNGESYTKKQLNDALMFAISAINDTNNLLLPSKQQDAEIRQAYNELFADIFTAVKDSTTDASANDDLLRRLQTYCQKPNQTLDPKKDLLRIKKLVRKPIKYINKTESEDQAKIDLKYARSELHAIFDDTEIKIHYRPLAALCRILKDSPNKKTFENILKKYYIHELHKFGRKYPDTKTMCETIDLIISNRWGLKRKRDTVKSFFKRGK